MPGAQPESPKSTHQNTNHAYWGATKETLVEGIEDLKKMTEKKGID